MSSKTETENSEQPFQLVQKRSSNQARRGMIRERPSHSKPQGHTEDSSRKRHPVQQHQRQERETRLRPQGSRSSQRQDQPRSSRDEGQRYTREHSWENELKPSDRTSSTSRFERRSISETVTSNRFKGLNPDSEAPSDLTAEGIGERRPRSHSLKGLSHARSKSPRRKGSKGEETQAQTGQESVQNEVAKMEVEKKTEGEGVEISVGNCIESESKETDTSESQDTSVESDMSDKPDKDWISYTREELMELKKHPLSQKQPRGLKEEFFRGGKWCAEAWLSPQMDSEVTELQDEGKPRHPSALNLIREHDSKHFQKVCLSPQRRSFGSGCSWKETGATAPPSSSTSPPPTQNSFLSEERDNMFDMEHPPPSGPRPPPPPNFSPGPPFQQGPPPSSSHMPLPHTPFPRTPRVIDHVPLKDREKDRRSWRKGGEWRQREQEEPEWMAFGPTDRSEFIELKGLDEHEREREARKEAKRHSQHFESDITGSDGQESPVFEEERWESEGGEGEGVDKRLLSPLVSEESVGVEEEVVEERSVGVKANREEEPENEFILDGFDFTSGVSICQELASEADDPEPLLPVKNPTELGSVLMKALRVGVPPPDGNHMMSMGHRPANALTLDEIHARENIYPVVQRNRDHDQTAFNNFVAQLQSSGTSQKESKQPQPPPQPQLPLPIYRQPEPPQKLPTPGPIGPPPPTILDRKNNFGYLLEKELDFDDELPSTFPTPPSHASLSLHSRMDPLPSNYGFPPRMNKTMSPHLPTPPQDKWMDDGAWVYPETHMDPLTLRHLDLMRPSPQQIARERHQQMFASSIASRTSSNQWAIEIERRRLLELNQMQQLREREKLLSAQAGISAMRPPISKPNISMLPTAVMKHMHSSKPSQPLLEMAKVNQTSMMAHRLDQELTSKASQTHSAFSALLGHSGGGLGGRGEYPSLGTRMRAPPMTAVPRNMSDPMFYPHYIPMPHGMPAQNPYMP